MAETNIRRPLTESEKQDMVEVGQDNILNEFLKKMAIVQQKHQKAYRPYDRYSARIDFEEKIRKLIGEVESTINPDAVDTKINLSDLDKYGKPDRFILINVSDTTQDKLLDGMRTTAVIGKQYKFKCKQRGNMITVFVPTEKVADMDKWISDKKMEKNL